MLVRWWPRGQEHVTFARPSISSIMLDIYEIDWHVFAEDGPCCGLMERCRIGCRRFCQGPLSALQLHFLRQRGPMAWSQRKCIGLGEHQPEKYMTMK